MNNQIKFCNVQLFYKVITNYINYHFEHGFGSSHSLISLPLSSSLICIYISLIFFTRLLFIIFLLIFSLKRRRRDDPTSFEHTHTRRDVNGARIDRRILYHPLPRHLKYSTSPSPFPASGRILPSSPSPRIPTVLADIHQL
jgi:hypothetical protein